VRGQLKTSNMSTAEHARTVPDSQNCVEDCCVCFGSRSERTPCCAQPIHFECLARCAKDQTLPCPCCRRDLAGSVLVILLPCRMECDVFAPFVARVDSIDGVAFDVRRTGDPWILAMTVWCLPDAFDMLEKVLADARMAIQRMPASPVSEDFASSASSTRPIRFFEEHAFGYTRGLSSVVELGVAMESNESLLARRCVHRLVSGLSEDIIVLPSYRPSTSDTFVRVGTQRFIRFLLKVCSELQILQRKWEIEWEGVTYNVVVTDVSPDFLKRVLSMPWRGNFTLPKWIDFKPCDHCMCVGAEKLCACRQKRYCDRECQRGHWKWHKMTCVTRTRRTDRAVV